MMVPVCIEVGVVSHVGVVVDLLQTLDTRIGLHAVLGTHPGYEILGGVIERLVVPVLVVWKYEKRFLLFSECLVWNTLSKVNCISWQHCIFTSRMWSRPKNTFS